MSMAALLLRLPISGLRCSPYGSTAALLDPTSARSPRKSTTLIDIEIA